MKGKTMAKLIRCISENGGVLVTALDSTEIVEEMLRIHHTSPVCSAALGRLLTGACLISANLKNTRDTLTLRVKGDGPIRSLIAVANGDGDVKGCIGDPDVELPLRVDGKLDVGGAVGHEGTLTVIKDMGLKEPYVGQVPLVSGEIADDLTSYYATSEQIPTVCALGVLVGRDCHILHAGGYLLQLLPGASEEEIDLLEKNVAGLKSMTALLSEGKTPQQIALQLLEGFNPNLLDEQETRYKCDCSRQRMERALISLGKKELTQLKEEKDELELGCQFCGAQYQFRASEILKLLEQG